MCLEVLTVVVFVLSWCAIAYYVAVNSRHVVTPVFIIIGNGVVLCIHLFSDCHVNYVKVGAAIEALLLFVLCNNVSNHSADPRPHTGIV
jgi:hypothetical protein